jgi:gliding motility-associated-like protein
VVTDAVNSSVTYTLIVTRNTSDNAFLANLQVSAGQLTPSFYTGSFSYSDHVGRLIDSITVTPTASNAFSTITVNGAPVISGNPSQIIGLISGINNITIVVTAQNGTNTRTYSLAVTKAPGLPGSTFQAVALYQGNGGATPADGINVREGISPNGDGINDVLVIDGIAAYPENRLLIMNRNGDLVFDARGYDNSSRVFDGHSNKTGAMQLPGTYFYSLQYKVGDETKYKTGFIVIKY